MELLSGLHSQDIESMLCVCLPYLTKDQMQQHCGSNDAGMLEETEHISLEVKIILPSIPSEWL